MVEHKRWKQLVSDGVWHHQASILFSPGRPARLHDHDFPEAFWVERGHGVHHINGQVKRLQAGDLVFVRPEDEHWLETGDERGFTLVNLAYDPRVRTDLVRRHAGELRALFSPPGDLPHRALLPKAALPLLRRQLARLGQDGRSRLALEYFLMGLHEQIRPWLGTEDRSPMPEWLRTACDRAQHPAVFVRGAAGLVQAAGRSSEHVARTMQAVLGQTPSDYVNRIRMEHAAREMRVTTRPIVDVALDCGITNLSHFYSLFREAHGLPPRAYRVAHQRTVA